MGSLNPQKWHKKHHMHVHLCCDLKIQPIVFNRLTTIWPRKWLQTTNIRAVVVLGMVLSTIRGGEGLGWSATLQPHPREDKQPLNATGGSWPATEVHSIARRLRGVLKKTALGSWMQQGPEAGFVPLTLAPAWPLRLRARFRSPWFWKWNGVMDPQA